MDGPLISAVLIVKDEQDNLPACLDALDGVVDEVVVVDTGSTDRTLELARARTDRVFSTPWADDFAAARNASLAHARGEWVLIVDADNRVEGGAAAGAKLRAFAAAHPPTTVGTVTIHNVDKGLGLFEETLEETERFFHRQTFRYEGAIHEQVVPIAGVKLSAETGVHFVHIGYAHHASDPAHKSRRNIPMLHAEIEKHPDDEYLYYQLGKAHYALKEYELAAHAFEAALERMQFEGTALPTGRVGTVSRAVVTGCLVNLAYAYINLGRAVAAVQLLDRHALLGHAGTRWADFAHVYGYVYLMLGDIARSRLAYETSIAMGPDREDVRGTGSFASLYHLGLLSEAESDHARAAHYYTAALASRPEYLPALSRGISWVVEGRPAEAAAILSRADPAFLKERYIERIAASLQNDKATDARAIRDAASSISGALGQAVETTFGKR